MRGGNIEKGLRENIEGHHTGNTVFLYRIAIEFIVLFTQPRRLCTHLVPVQLEADHIGAAG